MIELPESKARALLAKYPPEIQKRLWDKMQGIVEEMKPKEGGESPTEQEIVALYDLPVSRAEAYIKKFLPPFQEDIRARWEFFDAHPELIPVFIEKQAPHYKWQMTPEEAREVTGQVNTSEVRQFFTMMLKRAKQDFNDFGYMMDKKYRGERPGYSEVIPDSAERRLGEELGSRVNAIKRIGCHLNYDSFGRPLDLLSHDECKGVLSESELINERLSFNPKRFGRGSAPSLHLASD
jgi:hypothetical protein